MGQDQSAYATAFQKVTNNVLQSASNTCEAACSVQAENDILINIDDSANMIGIAQTCSASAACAITNRFSANVTNILTSMQSQKQTAETFPVSFTSQNQQEVTSITQIIQNNIAQIMVNNCSATSDDSVNGSLVYTLDSSAKTIGISQQGSAVANCTMQNIASVTITNQESSTQDQSQKAEEGLCLGCGMVLIVIAAIALLKIGSSQKGGQKSTVIKMA